jgi:hypothetical protein
LAWQSWPSPIVPAAVAPIALATIATRALIELGVVASDETPSASDQALAMSKLASVQAALSSQGVVNWPDDGIPAAVAEDYIRLTAIYLGSSFGKPTDPSRVGDLEQRIRRVAAILLAPQTAEDTVQSIHDMLVSTGIARWTVFDIPSAAELLYELLAANRMAPLFDKRVDPNAEMLAMQQLHKLIALPTTGATVQAVYF